jgi:proteasome lid subunit RPN8/RPN11
MGKRVIFEKEVIDSILTYAQMFHPKESILLLRGKIDKDKIVVNNTQIPPFASHGESFSSFPLHALPIDFSVIGVMHSHPNGVLIPSVEDLNHFYGRIMVITAYPYRSEQNIAVFDREGEVVKYEIA